MSHIHVKFRNNLAHRACHTDKCVMSHTHESCHTCTSSSETILPTEPATQINASCHTYMSHVTHTRNHVMSHTHESCHTYTSSSETILPTEPATQINASCHTYTSHVTRQVPKRSWPQSHRASEYYINIKLLNKYQTQYYINIKWLNKSQRQY